jgi:D-amino peptidase
MFPIEAAMSSISTFSRRRFLHGFGPLALGLNAARAAQSQPKAAHERPMKFFIHWDMEGASGIFTREQAWYWENGVRENVAMEARKLFTADVNAASAAALEAGATELIVTDTHHGGGNLLMDDVMTDRRIRYNQRSVGMENGKRRWMPGLDETVAGLMLPGHHAKAFTDNAFLPHTWSIEWADFQINGQSVGEIGIEACYAGHWDIPLILVEGDEAACYEARRQFPGVVTAMVKRDTSPESCTGLDPDAAHKELSRKVAEAIAKARTGQLKPYKPRLPMTISLRMRTMDGAAKAAQRPGVLRLDDHTVEARVGRQCDVVKWLLGTGLDMAPA